MEEIINKYHDENIKIEMNIYKNSADIRIIPKTGPGHLISGDLETTRLIYALMVKEMFFTTYGNSFKKVI